MGVRIKDNLGFKKKKIKGILGVLVNFIKDWFGRLEGKGMEWNKKIKREWNRMKWNGKN